MDRYYIYEIINGRALFKETVPSEMQAATIVSSRRFIAIDSQSMLPVIEYHSSSHLKKTTKKRY